MNKAKESNKGSFLDEGFHGTKALVGSLAYFNFGTESESLNLDYLFVCRLSPNKVVRLEICQKIYTTEFSGQKFYTLKTRKLRLLLETINNTKKIVFFHIFTQIL